MFKTLKQNKEMENIDPRSLTDKMPVTEVMRADEVNSEVFDPVSDKTINVISAESVKTSEAEINMILGQKKVLKVDVEPWISNIPNMVWETSNPEIILINPAEMIQGTIEAIGIGETEVVATNPLDNSMTKTWKITVVDGIKKNDSKEPEKEEGEVKE